MRSISMRIAFLCVLLILGSAIVFAAHHHSNATESAACTVCVAVQSASPTTPTLLPPIRERDRVGDSTVQVPSHRFGFLAA